MKSNQDEQVKFVWKWLRQLYSAAPIPSFTVDERTVGALHALILQVEERAQRHQLICSYARARSQQYRRQRTKLSFVNKSMGMELHNFSESGSERVRAMARLGSTLGVDSSDDARYMLALSELGQDRRHLEVDEGHYNACYGDTKSKYGEHEANRPILSQITELLRTSSSHSPLHQREEALIGLTKHTLKELYAARRLQARLESEKVANECRLTEITSSLPVWQAKGFQYQGESQKLSKLLQENGFEDILAPDNLTQQFERVKQSKATAATLRVRLCHFNNISSDSDLAKLQVKEAKVKLSNLQKRFDQALAAVLH